MRPSCLLHLARVISKITAWLSRELQDTALDVNVRDRRVLVLVGEREIVHHTLLCFLEKGRQLSSERRDVIKGVQKIDDEWVIISSHWSCFF
jgi:hypothetical protein